MRTSVIEHEIAVDPVLQVIDLPAQTIVKGKVVVRPLQTVSDAGGESIDLHDPVVAEHTDCQVGIGLAGVVALDLERCRLLAEEPRLCESEDEGCVIGSVGLELDGKVLGIAERNRPPCISLEHPRRREVVETDTDRSHECVGAPSSGEFQLAGRLLGHIVDQVDSVVHLVRNDGIAAFTGYGLRVELSQRGDFPDGPFEVTLAEKVARTCEYLAAYDLLAGQVIAVDDDIVQGGLLAFGDTDLHIHRVSGNVQLHRIDVEEQIAVVPVDLCDILVSLLAASGKPVLHGDHIIRVTLLDLQDLVQVIGGIDRVSSPCNIPEVVFLSLVELEIDGKAARFNVVDGIPDDPGITITGFLELADHVVLVIGILLLVEFLAAEEVVELVRLGLLHGPGEGEVLHSIVSIEVDVLDSDLFPTVHIEDDPGSVPDHGILLGLHIDLAVQEALFGIEALDDVGGSGEHIVGAFASRTETQAVIQLLLLSFLHSREQPGRDSRALGHHNLEECGIPLGTEMVNLQGDILEISLMPEPGGHAGEFLARDSNPRALPQTGKRDDLLGTVSPVPLDCNSTNYITDRPVVIYFDRSFPHFLSKGRNDCHHQEYDRKETTHSHRLNSLWFQTKVLKVQIYAII